MSNRPRIVVFAYSEPGYRALQELIVAQANIVAVYTHQDDPDEEIWFHSVYDLAAEHNIPVYRPAKITPEIAQEILALQPELIFSFYFRRLIPDEIIMRPRLGSYNLHGALLPKYRGQTCINWAVVNGEPVTGATLHVMTEAADEGDIVAQEACNIDFTDTALDVFLKVSDLAAKIIKQCLPALEAGTATLIPQDHSKATKFGRRRPKHGLLHWERSNIELYNLIRGVTHPFPGAFTYLGDNKLFIWWAIPLKQETSAPPGTILQLHPLRIATGDGVLEIQRWQWENETEHLIGEATEDSRFAVNTQLHNGPFTED